MLNLDFGVPEGLCWIRIFLNCNFNFSYHLFRIPCLEMICPAQSVIRRQPVLQPVTPVLNVMSLVVQPNAGVPRVLRVIFMLMGWAAVPWIHVIRVPSVKCLGDRYVLY